MQVSKENFPKVKEWVNNVNNPRVIPKLNSLEYDDYYYVGLVFEIREKEDIYTYNELMMIAEAAEYYKNKLEEFLQSLEK